MGPSNLAVCCDPVDNPLTFAHQTPNTVFLGMTTADTLGSLIAWAITAVANGVLKMLVERVVGMISKPLARYLSRAIGRAASTAVRQILRLARWAGVLTVESAAGAAIEATLGSIFNVEEARFDHTAIDDDIADAWDTYVVSP